MLSPGVFHSLLIHRETASVCFNCGTLSAGVGATPYLAKVFSGSAWDRIGEIWRTRIIITIHVIQFTLAALVPVTGNTVWSV